MGCLSGPAYYLALWPLTLLWLPIPLIFFIIDYLFIVWLGFCCFIVHQSQCHCPK